MPNETKELCESCKNEAKYIVDGIFRCIDCTQKYINEAYEDLTMIEKAQLMKITIMDIN